MKKIIVDMFGADGGPEIVVRGAVRALMAQSEYDIVLAGSTLIAQIVLQEEAARLGADPSELIPRLSVIETNSFVTNTEDPRNMVKDRNDTSMVLALEALKADEEIRAMVTAGSTGCALVGSCFHLGLEKGLLQPALASALPKAGGGFAIVLDCGSNLEPKAKELEQYARLGSALAKNSYGVEKPVVGLLNVGKEKGKGTEILQEAFEKIEASSKEYGFQFAGNIEGGDILAGSVDVIVCDGFTGNIIIKGFESAGLLAAQFAEQDDLVWTPEKNTAAENAPEAETALAAENALTAETALAAENVMSPETALTAETAPALEKDPAEQAARSLVASRIKRFFDYNSQAGAIFVGTKKRIIKAHGAATEDTITSCILQAISLDQ